MLVHIYECLFASVGVSVYVCVWYPCVVLARIKSLSCSQNFYPCISSQTCIVLCRGELYPVETEARLCDELTTGEEVEVDMEKDMLTVLSTGKQYSLKALGDVRFVVVVIVAMSI